MLKSNIGKQYYLFSLAFALGISGIAGCSMSEEVKRIDELRRMEQRQKSAQSEELTGEQIFIRSCNTCHPRGRAAIGPTLDHLNEHFSDDTSLKQFIRQGKSLMPAQTKDNLSDSELDNLVVYLRALNPH